MREGRSPPWLPHLFQRPDAAVAVLWLEEGADAARVRLTDAKLAFMDLLGNPLPDRALALSPTPVYVLGPGLTAEPLSKAVKLEQ